MSWMASRLLPRKEKKKKGNEELMIGVTGVVYQQCQTILHFTMILTSRDMGSYADLSGRPCPCLSS